MTTYLLIAVITLQLADGVTTWRGLSSGIGREAAPGMVWLFARFGSWRGPLLLVKLAVAAWFMGCAYLVNWLQAGLSGASAQAASAAWLATLLLVALGYAWVVWSNVRVLRKGGGHG